MVEATKKTIADKFDQINQEFERLSVSIPDVQTRHHQIETETPSHQAEDYET